MRAALFAIAFALMVACGLPVAAQEEWPSRQMRLAYVSVPQPASYDGPAVVFAGPWRYLARHGVRLLERQAWRDMEHLSLLRQEEYYAEYSWVRYQATHRPFWREWHLAPDLWSRPVTLGQGHFWSWGALTLGNDLSLSWRRGSASANGAVSGGTPVRVSLSNAIDLDLLRRISLVVRLGISRYLAFKVEVGWRRHNGSYLELTLFSI